MSALSLPLRQGLSKFIETHPRIRPLFTLARVTFSYLGVSIPFELYNFTAILMLEALGSNPAVIWFPLWVFDVTGKYVINSRVTWKDNRLSGRKLASYWVVAIVGGAVQYLVFIVLIRFLPTAIALICAKVVNTAINILGNHFFTFRKQPE